MGGPSTELRQGGSTPELTGKGDMSGQPGAPPSPVALSQQGSHWNWGADSEAVGWRMWCFSRLLGAQLICMRFRNGLVNIRAW